MSTVDLDYIRRIAFEDADKIALTGNGETRESLRRYRLARLLEGHTVAELRDALTPEELARERRRHARGLRKDDFVKLLVSRIANSSPDDVTIVVSAATPGGETYQWAVYSNPGSKYLGKLIRANEGTWYAQTPKADFDRFETGTDGERRAAAVSWLLQQSETR